MGREMTRELGETSMNHRVLPLDATLPGPAAAALAAHLRASALPRAAALATRRPPALPRPSADLLPPPWPRVVERGGGEKHGRGLGRETRAGLARVSP